MSDKASEISALLAPTVESLGLELLGTEYLPSPGGAVLRLYIDVPAGEDEKRACSDSEGSGNSVAAQYLSVMPSQPLVALNETLFFSSAVL